MHAISALCKTYSLNEMLAHVSDKLFAHFIILRAFPPKKS